MGEGILLSLVADLQLFQASHRNSAAMAMTSRWQRGETRLSEMRDARGCLTLASVVQLGLDSLFNSCNSALFLFRNAERATVSKDNPELDRILALAVCGMPVPVVQEFHPKGYGNRSPLRPKYLDAGAVDKMVYDSFREKAMTFILLLHVIVRSTKALYLSPLSWTSKEGKRQGRNIRQ